MRAGKKFEIVLRNGEKVGNWWTVWENREMTITENNTKSSEMKKGWEILITVKKKH